MTYKSLHLTKWWYFYKAQTQGSTRTDLGTLSKINKRTVTNLRYLQSSSLKRNNNFRGWTLCPQTFSRLPLFFRFYPPPHPHTHPFKNFTNWVGVLVLLTLRVERLNYVCCGKARKSDIHEYRSDLHTSWRNYNLGSYEKASKYKKWGGILIMLILEILVMLWRILNVHNLRLQHILIWSWVSGKLSTTLAR